MNTFTHQPAKGFHLMLAVLGGVSLLLTILLLIGSIPLAVRADPIAPPVGYPKLSLSVKTVTPTLAATGGATLHYAIEIRNTGAYTAAGVTLSDDVPAHTTFTGAAGASASPPPTVTAGTLTWVGKVAFDATVVVSFGVNVDESFSGTVHNTAVISHPLIAHPITVTAETVVTNRPILVIEKTASPTKPGANKPLIYSIVVANQGQATLPSMPITVTDRVPSSTTVLDVGMGGGTDGDVVTWTRPVTLDLGETTEFTFSVRVGDVSSGTLIVNDGYQVASPETGVTAGEPYTVTVVDPILSLSKHIWPNPPGSNRELTYTLELFNVGSLATGLVITDQIPEGVVYKRGGTANPPLVSWNLDSLDTGESAEFTFTVYISDVMALPIVNDNYAVCSAEQVCASGKALSSVVKGPVFEVFATLDPFAKKPGAGNTPVTPTLAIRNLGPGNALGAKAVLYFDQMNVSGPNDITVFKSDGSSGPGGTLGISVPPEKHCGEDCWFYYWEGNLGFGESITFTIENGTNTTTGDVEGATYTTTVVITDALGGISTVPITATAIGTVTLQANLLATKSAPKVVGRGGLISYTIGIFNSGVTVDGSPDPYLWEVLPISGTKVISSSISHGGKVKTVLSGSLEMTVISWTLPALATGERLQEPRSFAVRVDDNLVSGTQIINHSYRVNWHEGESPDVIFYNIGPPVTTVVKEVGLIDSYKEVTPTLALPGPGNVFTYYLHIVNSSPLLLHGVTVYDQLPWQHSTYQRDAVASAGQVVSDVVSIRWEGDVAPLSSEVVTFTVLVDSDYKGAITNTATISHPNLSAEVEVQAIAYVSEKPILQITKSASPDPVERDAELLYRIRVVNRGQQATSLVITDMLPLNTTYITDSATAGGQLVSDQVRWETSVLEPGESRSFEFRVAVGSGREVVNDHYVVRCAEGVVSVGAPVVTRIAGGDEEHWIYLPLVMRNASTR